MQRSGACHTRRSAGREGRGRVAYACSRTRVGPRGADAGRSDANLSARARVRGGRGAASPAVVRIDPSVRLAAVRRDAVAVSVAGRARRRVTGRVAAARRCMRQVADLPARAAIVRVTGGVGFAPVRSDVVAGRIAHHAGGNRAASRLAHRTRVRQFACVAAAPAIGVVGLRIDARARVFHGTHGWVAGLATAYAVRARRILGTSMTAGAAVRDVCR